MFGVDRVMQGNDAKIEIHGILAMTILIVIAGTLTTTNDRTMLKEPITKLVANIWSTPINGLSGQLRVEFEDLQPGLRYAVYLELRNHSLNSVTVINQPLIHAELFDSTGKPVSTSSLPMSGAVPNPQWAVIPNDAYIGFRIDMQTVGVPTREHGKALLAVGGKSWELMAGKYILKTILAFKNDEDGPKNQWCGELELPPVELVVTTEMLAV